MPTIIPTLLLAAKVITATTALYTTVAITVAQVVYGSAQRRRRERRAKRKYNESLQDRTVTGVATDSPARYVYGRTRVGSRIVAMFTSGSKDQYKHLVCVHADHECDGIEEMYIAGKKVSNNRDADGWLLDGPFGGTKTVPVEEICPYGTTKVTLKYRPTESPLSLTDRRFYVVDVALQPPNHMDSPFKTNDGTSNAIIISGSVLNGQELTIGPVPDFAAGRDFTGWQYVIYYSREVHDAHARISSHLGYPGEPADSYLMRVVPDKWTARHRLAGKCYSVVTVNLNDSEFQGGPPTVEVVLRGAKLYDFRTGVTQWSQNVVLAAYHYLTSDMCGIPASDLPMSKWIAAANVCDEQIPLGVFNGPRYTVNGSVTSDQKQTDVLEQMADAMAGNIVATTWDITAGKYTAPVMALQKEDIVGAWSINPGVPEGELFNGVRGQYFSSESGYVATDFQPYQNPHYLLADGRELWDDNIYPFTDSVRRVHNLCRIEMEQLRNGLTFKAVFSLKAWGLKVDDRVTLTHDVFGWNAKVFVILDKRYTPVTGGVELTLKEDAPEIWDLADAVTADATPNTNLPDPFYVAPLASLSWTSGTDELQQNSDGTITTRMRVRWPDPPLAVGVVELEWTQLGTGVWQSTSVSVDNRETYISPIRDGGIYVVRGRLFDPYLNRRSIWIYAPTAQALGKTVPPSDVASLFMENGALSWPAIPDVDRAGYRVRFQYGYNKFWGNAVPLHDPATLVTASPWRPDVMPPGLLTIMVKAVDTSGNESVNPAVVVANIGDPIVENLVLTYDFKASGWPSANTVDEVGYGWHPAIRQAADLSTFSRASLATVIAGNGVIQTVAADVPRFDHDPVTLAKRGLLIEPPATNLVTHSSDFSAWTDHGGAAIAPGDIAPDGASTMTIFAGTGQSLGEFRTKTFNGTMPGEVYACSFFVKQGTAADWRVVALREADGLAIAIVIGTWDGSGGLALTHQADEPPIAYHAENFGNGVYRVTFHFTALGASTAIELGARSSGIGTASTQYWGVQLEHSHVEMGSEALINGGFDGGSSEGWTATVAPPSGAGSAGEVVFNAGGYVSIRGNGTDASRIAQGFPTIPGMVYVLTCTTGGGPIYLDVGTDEGGSDLLDVWVPVSSNRQYRFVATAAAAWVSFSHTGTGFRTVDMVSIRPIQYVAPASTYIPTAGAAVTRAGEAASLHGIEGGEIVDGNLVGQDSGDAFWGRGNEPFWEGDTLPFWPAASYLTVTYVTSYSVQPAEAGSRLTILSTVDAVSVSFEYRYNTQGMFWGAENDLFWGDDDAGFWPGPTEWQGWVGGIDNIREGAIEFRIVMQGGSVRPSLSDLVLQFDVEDESETINDVFIPPSGTRLPLTKAYRLIKNVSLTLQDDGGSAFTALFADKSTAGPLVFCRNSAGANVAGLIDATVQGVKG